MSFLSEWNRETKAVVNATEETIKVIAIELFSGVITTSPIGNPSLWKKPNSAPEGYTGGSFKANWYLTKTSESAKYDEDADTDGKVLIANLTKRIKAEYSPQWILTNNAPYAQRLESGNWSTQVPNGIVAPNVTAINAQIKRIETITNKKYGVF